MRSNNWNNLSSNNESMCSNKGWSKNYNRCQADNNVITKKQMGIKNNTGYNKKIKYKRTVKEREIINSFRGWMLVKKCLREDKYVRKRRNSQLVGLINMTICTLEMSQKSCINTRLLTLYIKRNRILIAINPCQGRIITQEFKKSLKLKLIRT